MNNGRKKIFTNYTSVDDTNIVDILEQAWIVQQINVGEENYLFDYLKGVQPILEREKKIRPEINNKIVENHALSIVEFKTGYLLEKPIQYVSARESSDDESMLILNGCLALEGKDSQDMLIASDQATCGVGYRLVLPNKRFVAKDYYRSPFKIYRIKPQDAFVIYTSDIGNAPLVGAIAVKVKDENNQNRIRIHAYTKDTFYEYFIDDFIVKRSEPNYLGEIPLIEYPYNEQRMGAFEPVIPLLDAINKVESNRVDGVEQFVQSLLVFKNIDIEKDQLTALLEMGAIKIKDNGELEANVEYLTQELNQSQVQTLINHMLNIVYKIAGMPVQNSSGGGDNGLAVVYKDGWTEVESKIQRIELSFKDSERQFLNILLHILKVQTFEEVNIRSFDIEIKFTRRNYENAWTKAQTLDLLLKNPHVHPRLAFVYSGISADPEGDYLISEEYYKEYLKTLQSQNEQQQQPQEEVVEPKEEE